MSKSKNRNSNGRKRRLTLTLLAIFVLAAGSVTVISRQSARTAERQTQMADQTDFVKAKVASQDKQINVEQQDLAAADAQKLAAGMKDLVNQSTEGLSEVRHADGSVSLDLEGRFQNVTVAKINKDGSISQSCVDNPKAAGAFFGIDPKLIDPDGDSTGAKPSKTNPKTRN